MSLVSERYSLLFSWLDLVLVLIFKCFICSFSFVQKLCEMVCDLLLEESNVHYVATPVTICGDIHGQVCCPKN